MILIIDNYDSFTYNLYQAIGHFNSDIEVFRNDKITLSEIEKLKPSHLVISPGPKYPKEAGISVEAIKHFSGKLPILGVCLGHQAIGEAFGAKIVRAEEIYHGKTSSITLDLSCPLFKGLEPKVEVGRYHSLVIEPGTLPSQLEVKAVADRGEVMSVQHHCEPTFGLQFHPESILTEVGSQIIYNFLEV